MLGVLGDDRSLRIVVGGTAALSLSSVPANTTLVHPMSAERKLELLRTAHAGLNPVDSGGGMAHKVSEYLAAGLPTVSTRFGLRGFPPELGGDAWTAEIDDFGRAIADLRGTPAAELAARVRRGRELAERRLDWSASAEKLAGHHGARELLGIQAVG
jgi:glycosyltransferase involved in cell wall biosynthesis